MDSCLFLSLFPGCRIMKTEMVWLMAGLCIFKHHTIRIKHLTGNNSETIIISQF